MTPPPCLIVHGSSTDTRRRIDLAPGVNDVELGSTGPFRVLREASDALTLISMGPLSLVNGGPAVVPMRLHPEDLLLADDFSALVCIPSPLHDASAAFELWSTVHDPLTGLFTSAYLKTAIRSWCCDDPGAWSLACWSGSGSRVQRVSWARQIERALPKGTAFCAGPAGIVALIPLAIAPAARLLQTNASPAAEAPLSLTALPEDLDRFVNERLDGLASPRESG